MNNTNMKNIEKIVFGGGCFWCTEAVFQMLKGVVNVYPAYVGGEKPYDSYVPTYEMVCTGDTGYVESVVVEFDPEVVSLNDLLTVFFASHNPTEKNRQGNDLGTQYASVIFYENENQKKISEDFIEELNKNEFGGKIVTEVRPVKNLFKAEDYHKDYYRRNQSQAYCQVVINPKLEKVQKRFAELLRVD